jgi:hypothetical protein
MCYFIMMRLRGSTTKWLNAFSIQLQLSNLLQGRDLDVYTLLSRPPTCFGRYWSYWSRLYFIDTHQLKLKTRGWLQVPFTRKNLCSTSRDINSLMMIVIVSYSSSSSAHYSPLMEIALSNFSSSRSIFGYSHPAPASRPAQIVTPPGLRASYTTFT